VADVIGCRSGDFCGWASRTALFREKLANAGLIEKLFDRFDQQLAAKGYMARGGQMVATIVPVSYAAQPPCFEWNWWVPSQYGSFSRPLNLE
jgi:hypothetical protein